MEMLGQNKKDYSKSFKISLRNIFNWKNFLFFTAFNEKQRATFSYVLINPEASLALQPGDIMYVNQQKHSDFRTEFKISLKFPNSWLFSTNKHVWIFENFFFPSISRFSKFYFPSVACFLKHRSLSLIKFCLLPIWLCTGISKYSRGQSMKSLRKKSTKKIFIKKIFNFFVLNCFKVEKKVELRIFRFSFWISIN